MPRQLIHTSSIAPHCAVWSYPIIDLPLKKFSSTSFWSLWSWPPSLQTATQSLSTITICSLLAGSLYIYQAISFILLHLCWFCSFSLSLCCHFCLARRNNCTHQFNIYLCVSVCVLTRVGSNHNCQCGLWLPLRTIPLPTHTPPYKITNFQKFLPQSKLLDISPKIPAPDICPWKIP